jgi:hypothetical protein
VSRPVRAIAPLALIAVIALAGCGDGDGDDSDQLDAAELISRGDELCREGQKRFAEIQEAQLQNPKDAVAQTGELIEVAGDELEELRSLRAPDELGEAYGRYLTARTAALEQLEEGRAAATGRDAKGYTRAQAELASGAKERRRLAREVGFEVCSQAPRGGAARTQP